MKDKRKLNDANLTTALTTYWQKYSVGWECRRRSYQVVGLVSIVVALFVIAEIEVLKF